MRELNLYSGLGGNRKNWTDVEVTEIEYDEEISNIDKDFFLNDKVIVTADKEYQKYYHRKWWHENKERIKRNRIKRNRIK